jgi:hypothetical protein
MRVKALIDPHLEHLPKEDAFFPQGGKNGARKMKQKSIKKSSSG